MGKVIKKLDLIEKFNREIDAMANLLESYNYTEEQIGINKLNDDIDCLSINFDDFEQKMQNLYKTQQIKDAVYHKHNKDDYDKLDHIPIITQKQLMQLEYFDLYAKKYIIEWKLLINKLNNIYKNTLVAQAQENYKQLSQKTQEINLVIENKFDAYLAKLEKKMYNTVSDVIKNLNLNTVIDAEISRIIKLEVDKIKIFDYLIIRSNKHDFENINKIVNILPECKIDFTIDDNLPNGQYICENDMYYFHFDKHSLLAWLEKFGLLIEDAKNNVQIIDHGSNDCS